MTRHLKSIAIVLLLALAGTACSGDPPAPSPSASFDGVPTGSASAPTDSAPPSDEPSTPSPSGEAQDSPFRQVVADALSLRTDAGTDATLVASLPRGTPLRVESGPTDADGFTWYEVTDLGGRRGWVADGDGEDAWLASVPDVDGGTPILVLEAACDVVGPVTPPQTVIMDDGWVVARENRPDSVGWVVRQLSADGMAQVRNDVLRSPYLQASATYEPEPLPGAEPPGHGACLFTFTIPNGAEPVVVRSVNWFGDAEEAEFWQPSPERKALDAIAGNLSAITSLLGEQAWQGPSTPYVAEEYLLDLGGGEGIDPAVLGIGDLEAFGAPSPTGRCGFVTRAQAFEIAGVLNRADPGLAIRLDAISILTFQLDGGGVSGIMSPRFPTDQPPCQSA